MPDEKWLGLWKFAEKIAPHQANAAWQWIMKGQYGPTKKEWSRAERKVIGEGQVELRAEKNIMGTPLPWEKRRLITEQLEEDRALYRAEMDDLIFDKLPQKIADELRSGRHEVIADRAGARREIDAHALAVLVPDLVTQQLVGSGGVAYDNIAIRERQALAGPETEKGVSISHIPGGELGPTARRACEAMMASVKNGDFSCDQLKTFRPNKLIQNFGSYGSRNTLQRARLTAITILLSQFGQ